MSDTIEKLDSCSDKIIAAGEVAEVASLCPGIGAVGNAIGKTLIGVGYGIKGLKYLKNKFE